MVEKKKTTKVVKKNAEVKTLEQLKTDLIAKQADLIQAKRSHHLGELTNPHILTTTRKEIARLKTAIAKAVIADTKEDK